MLASLMRTNLLSYIAEDLGSFWDSRISPTGNFKEDCEIALVSLLRSIRLGQEPQSWLAQDTIDTASILNDLSSKGGN